MTIPDLGLKIKNIWAAVVGDWGLVGIVVLVSLTSFGLGRLSAVVEARPIVDVRMAQMQPAPQAMRMGGLVVASRSGSAYYYPWCAGAQKIALGNQRWFTSEAAARSAGYAPAKNCKGLGEAPAGSQ